MAERVILDRKDGEERGNGSGFGIAWWCKMEWWGEEELEHRWVSDSALKEDSLYETYTANCITRITHFTNWRNRWYLRSFYVSMHSTSHILCRYSVWRPMLLWVIWLEIDGIDCPLFCTTLFAFFCVILCITNDSRSFLCSGIHNRKYFTNDDCIRLKTHPLTRFTIRDYFYDNHRHYWTFWS